jgi:Mn-dependent DtxR family transcriptional regulator
MADRPQFKSDLDFAKEMAKELGISLKEALESFKAMQEDRNRKSNKRGGIVSRKRGKKIMHGYKIGGKV